MKQPRRTRFSCFLRRPMYFPCLGSLCVELYQYGTGYRPKADGRCRQVIPHLYRVCVSAWRAVWHRLSDLSTVIPPNHYDVLTYSGLFGSEMGCHRDRSTDKDKCHSQLPGTDVITITLGDSMIYQLLNKKNNSIHETVLENASINIHTAHDDRCLFHSLRFPKDHVKNCIRIAIVCRWVRKVRYYRCLPNEVPNVRFCIVDPEAYADLKGRTYEHEWRKKLCIDNERLPWLTSAN